MQCISALALCLSFHLRKGDHSFDPIRLLKVAQSHHMKSGYCVNHSKRSYKLWVFFVCAAGNTTQVFMHARHYPIEL